MTDLQRDKETQIFFDYGNESKCSVKVDAYEIFIYNIDVSYQLFPLSGMSHTEMLHLNLRSFSLLKSLFKINLNQMNHSFSIRFDPMISW